MKNLLILCLVFIFTSCLSAQESKADSTQYKQVLQQKDQLTTQIIQIRADLYIKEKQLDELVKQYQVLDYAIQKEEEILKLKTKDKK